MIDEIMSLALGNGLWAALFCMLFLYQLRDSRTREKKYAETIDSLTDSLSGVKAIRQECSGISETLLQVKSDCKVIKSDCQKIKSTSAEIKSGVKSLGGGEIAAVAGKQNAAIAKKVSPLKAVSAKAMPVSTVSVSTVSAVKRGGLQSAQCSNSGVLQDTVKAVNAVKAANGEAQ